MTTGIKIKVGAQSVAAWHIVIIMNSDWNHVLLLEIRCWNRQYVCIILWGIYFSPSYPFNYSFTLKDPFARKVLFGYALSFTSLCVIHLGMHRASRIYCITNFWKEIIEKMVLDLVIWRTGWQVVPYDFWRINEVLKMLSFQGIGSLSGFESLSSKRGLPFFFFFCWTKCGRH